MDGDLSPTPERDIQPNSSTSSGLTMAPILNRTLPGACNPSNKGSISWGCDGCIAYGCGSSVVVVEVATAQVLQTLSKHRSSVVRTAWCSRSTPEDDQRKLILASADALGQIIVWDVIQGQAVKQFHDGNQAISELVWLDSRVQHNSHMLAAIHPPNHLVLWNASTGTKVWKASYDEMLLGLDINPFSCYKAMFRCHNCILFVDDFRADKCPSGEGKRFYILTGKEKSPGKGLTSGGGGGGGAGGHNNGSLGGGVSAAGNSADQHGPGGPGGSSGGGGAKGKSNKGTKLTRIMRQMVLGENRHGHFHSMEGGGGGGAGQTECLVAKYHRAVKNQILLAFAKEVLIVDVELSQTIGSINLERAHSSLSSLTTCSVREVLYILHESGCVSVWSRKTSLSVLATPGMSRSQSVVAGLTGSTRTPLLPSSASSFFLDPARTPGFPHGGNYLENGFGLAGSDVILEVSYESKVQSDHVRMGKNCKVLGMAVHPLSEKQVCVLTTDGRIFSFSLVETREKSHKLPPVDSKVPCEKLAISSILGGSAPAPSVIRMCPAMTVRNYRDYSALLATGSNTGNILVYNVSTGVLLRELAVHTNVVKGVEWTTGNPAHTLLSFAHHAVTGSHLVRNELVHTNILSGKMVNLRQDRGEESHITMIRISHVKQYFVIAFAAAPFELWDLRKLCILRTMPKKFPMITALAWSPLHSSRSKRKSESAGGCEREEGEGIDTTLESPVKAAGEEMVSLKEHILFTDQDCQLYHFSVEGHSIRDGTKIPAETGLGTINAISCKSDYIVRGDTDGNINIWNIKARQSKNIHTGRGNIQQIRFSPGRGNLKILVQHNDGVAIWDIKEMDFINELKSPRDIGEIVGVDWAASDRVILATQDSGIRLMGLGLAGSCSDALSYGRDQLLSCPGVLPDDVNNRLCFSLAYTQPPTDDLLTAEEDDDKAVLTAANNKTEDLIDDSVEQQTEHILNVLLNQLDGPTGPKNFVDRQIEVAHMFGQQFEKLLWRLVQASVAGEALPKNWDIFCDKRSYIEHEEERCGLHLNRAADKKSRTAVTARLLCLGQLEPAVKLLLESEPDDENFLADQLLACLISTTAATVGGTHLSTSKMVATKLIAEGELWEGVQLLCLIGKVGDACTYLKASKRWEESMWLAKSRLSDQEYKELASKYAEHLTSLGRIQEAALLHASLQNWGGCLEALHLGQYRALAVLLLQYVLNHRGEPAGGQKEAVPVVGKGKIGQDSEKNEKEDDTPTLDPVLVEAIRLEAARFLFQISYDELAETFCSLLGAKGEELRKEYLQTPPTVS